MASERLVRVFLLVVLGLVAMGALRPSSPDPREDVRSRETWFFINKAHQTATYDVVIVGDSRALRGLSPAEIAEYLPGLSVYNMAFNAGGMNDEMYGEAQKLLDPDSPRPMIVLAPTSLAFLPHKKNNSQFREYRNKPQDQVWLYRSAPALADWFQPLSPSVYIRRWFDIQPKELLVQTFSPLGWIATDQTPLDDVTDLSIQRKILADYDLDETLVDDFMTQTRTWTEAGIRVFSVFVPAYPPREALEDSMLHFDRDAFQTSVTAAGGICLDITAPDYVTYDGSHLVSESALLASRRLGQAMAAHLSPTEAR